MSNRSPVAVSPRRIVAFVVVAIALVAFASLAPRQDAVPSGALIASNGNALVAVSHVGGASVTVLRTQPTLVRVQELFVPSGAKVLAIAFEDGAQLRITTTEGPLLLSAQPGRRARVPAIASPQSPRGRGNELARS